jgi:hypothetical protein
MGGLTLTPPWRKGILAVHLGVSVGWIGGVLVYLVLGLLAVRSQDDSTIRAAWIAMDVAGWFVLVPLATGTVLTGLLLALATRWGLLRYYWVLISFILTCFAAMVLVVHMPSVSAVAEVARRADGTQLRELGGDLLHPSVGLVVLVAVLVLNVYKPPGLTRFGWRKQHAARALPAGVDTRTDARRRQP